MKTRWIAVLGAVFALLISMPVLALPSLDPADQYEVKADTDNDGTLEAYTVLQDATVPTVWYYVPKSPRLAVRNDLPVFSLLRFQSDNDGAKPDEGSIMQFAVNMALPAGAQTSIKDQIAKLEGPKGGNLKADSIRLNCIPLSSATVLLGTLDGKVVASGTIAGGIAPTYPNQDMVFQIRSDANQTDLYQALIKGNGGVPIFYCYAFEGVSPRCGIEVTVDWDQLYTHYSKNTKSKEVHGRWFWSSVSSTNNKEMTEDLVNTKSVQVKILGNDKVMSSEEIEQYLQPIMERINKELAMAASPPERIPAAEASEPQIGWFSGHDATSSAESKGTKHASGKETFRIDKQMVLERTSACSSLINISKWLKKDPTLENKLVVTCPKGNWAKFYFKLPTINVDLSKYGVSQLDMTINIVGGDKQPLKLKTSGPNEAAMLDQKLVSYDVGNRKWKMGSEDAMFGFWIPMAAAFAKLTPAEIAKIQYKSEVTITQVLGTNTQKYTFVNYTPITNGQHPVSDPATLFDIITVNGSDLIFYKKDQPTPLTQVNAALSFKYGENLDKEQKLNASLDNDNGNYFYGIVPRNAPYTMSLDAIFRGVDQGKPLIPQSKDSMRVRYPTGKITLINDDLVTLFTVNGDDLTFNKNNSDSPLTDVLVNVGYQDPRGKAATYTTTLTPTKTNASWYVMTDSPIKVKVTYKLKGSVPKKEMPIVGNARDEWGSEMILSDDDYKSDSSGN